MSEFSFKFDQNELIAIGAMASPPAAAPLALPAPTFRGKVLPRPPFVGRRAGISFPIKLHTLLNDATRLGFEDVVSWQPTASDNTSYFKVHKPDTFAREIMQSYFNQTKFKSFQRQLNLYGFIRMHQGVFRGCYTHKSFVRGQPSLTREMQRKKPTSPILEAATSGGYLSGGSSGDEEPIPFPVKSQVKTLHAPAVDSSPEDQDDTANEIRIFEQFFEGGEPTQHIDERDAMSVSEMVSDVSGEGYQDIFEESSSWKQNRTGQPQQSNTAIQSTIQAGEMFTPVHERSFPWKLYTLLETAENPESGLSHIVSWDTGGSFTIYDNKAFLEQVMPLYFDQSVFESFRRQLNLYGFSRLGRGALTSTYFHPNFSRGNRELCRQIVRHAPRRALAQQMVIVRSSRRVSEKKAYV